MGFELPLSAAEPERVPHNQDAPPGPALTPDEAAARMTVPEGFSVEVVAAEPDLVNPVAMTFDERGRIWVAESLEYPRLEAGAGRDRIRVLEDTDHDGRVDRFTTFAEGLNIPSGIAVGYGGAWVANSPDILFLADDDGDLRADRREVVVTGFGRDDTHELPNSLTWGPDGWLYGLNGVFNRSRIEQAGRVHEFTCALWRIHPRTRRFEVFAEGTSNPWGIAWDAEGSAFLSACVIDHLWHIVETGYYHRQAGAYPPHTWKIESIVDHKHQKAAYCGIHYFDSPAYPEQFRRRLYMGNIHGNAINTDRLVRHGATYRGEPEADLLRANDAWFMPVAQKTGPDGCLYILDWYDRYHCYQDARRDAAGIDRLKGRLYRLRYGDSPRAAEFDLARESDEQLIARLHDENIYFRDLAQRVLSERASSEARPRLESLVLDDAAPRDARMHALWALLGAGDLDRQFHQTLLSHADASLRAWAVRAAGNQRKLDPELQAEIVSLAQDPVADVRLQVAIASRKVEGLDPLSLLLGVLAQSAEDPLLPRVVWQNLHPLLEERESVDRFLELASTSEFAASPASGLMTERILERLLSRHDKDLQPAVQYASLLLAHGDTNPAAAQAALGALFERVRSAELNAAQRTTLSESLEPRLRTIIDTGPDHPHYQAAALLSAACGGVGTPHVLAAFRSDEAPVAWRIQAIEALVVAPPATLWEQIEGLFAHQPPAPRELRRATLRALEQLDEARVAQFALATYPQLERELQSAAIELLVSRESWGRALLDAIDAGEMAPQSLNVNQVQQLLAGGNEEMAERIRATWGAIRSERNPERERVIRDVRVLLGRNRGDAEAGVLVFKKACAECHRIHGAGEEVGPDITLNGRNSFEQLLSNVLDPSLVVGVAYQARTIVTIDGRIFRGLVVEESPERVVLKVQGGQFETVAREAIDEMEASALSLMPEGIERQLSERELLDLFAFLALDRPPSDPEAKRLPGAP